jgi:alkylation response protein AidB-like acyl-CoA dehydrogenase
MSTEFSHPSTYLNVTVIDPIRSHAFTAEQEGALHKEQLQIICDHQWFKMFVPKKSGGLGLTLPEILKIEEGLSWVDGSLGWVVTLCSGAGWFYGFLDPSLADQIFNSRKMCLAGSGAITGTAEITANGFVINGFWKYASGARHATAFTANCLITKDGVQQSENGKASVRSFLLMPDEIKIINSWQSMGMVATGSHSFIAENVQVPNNRAFIIEAQHVTDDDPVFRFPFLQLAETTLAVNLSGMACRFLDLCVEIFREKNNSAELLTLPGDFENRLNAARKNFHTVTENSWNALVSQALIPDALLAEVSELSYALVHESRRVLNELYPHCGLAAADKTTEINRVWRNFHTASQHSLFKGK